jgi:glucose/arabinose dehydrogenase
MRLPLVTALATLLLAACGDDAGLELADGYRAEVLVEDLDSPTQFLHGPDGRLWVAQLAQTAGAGGTVLAVPTGGVGEPEVLLDGLDHPTGLAVLDQALWIQLERDLARVPIDDQGDLGPLERVLTDLPYDGQAQGTLTVTLDRTLLFTTTGAIAGGEVVAGSGMLWELDPAAPDAPAPYAAGFRNAYAHTVDGDGQIWATDITDAPADGPEELNRVSRGADHGWPHCVGHREPVPAHGGSEAVCAATEPPAATFPADAAPTSVVASPWRADELVVALHGTGELVTVRPDAPGTPAGDVLAAGFARPQHIVVTGGHLLVGDHERGAIYRISRR